MHTFCRVHYPPSISYRHQREQRQKKERSDPRRQPPLPLSYKRHNERQKKDTAGQKQNGSSFLRHFRRLIIQVTIV